jgi:hypothetical protein
VAIAEILFPLLKEDLTAIPISSQKNSTGRSAGG